MTGAPAAALRPLTLAGILAAALALRWTVALRPLLEVDDLAIPDDAYLSLTLARSIARGLGPFYGLAPTNGFQPLYVFLMAPLCALLGGTEAPLRAALLGLAAFDVAGLFLLHRLLARAGIGPWGTLAAVSGWALNPYGIQTAVNGLETSMAFFFLVGAFDALLRLRLEPGRAARPWAAAGLGLWLGGAALARIDSLLLVPLAGWALAGAARRAGLGPAAGARAIGIAAAAAAAVYAPWLAYSWAWTGTVFPVSGRAVRYMTLSAVEHAPTWGNLYGPMLGRALDVLARKNAAWLALAAALAAAMPRAARRTGWPGVRRRLGHHAPAFVFAVGLLAAYGLVVFGSWHFPRYFYPVTLAFALLVAALVDLHATAIASAGRRAAFGAACTALLVAGLVAHPSFGRLFGPRPEPWGYARVGLWARDHFPPGTVIGGSQTGALGWFADSLVVVNLDGVVNRDCYEAMRAGRALPYVREAGVEWLVWQDDLEFLARETRGPPGVRLVREGHVPGIRTWGEPWDLYRVEVATDR